MYLMIVEDEKFIRDGILYLLSEVPGITEIDTACDGEEAWSVITDSRRFPDIVLTDIRMPGMDGLELHTTIIYIPDGMMKISGRFQT